ncbi:MAG: hypothetical protein KDD61_10850 [Bdellovibrionales bacterium]|nr:hypothetical protein [Bdellovibrionales bacterium]
MRTMILILAFLIIAAIQAKADEAGQGIAQLEKNVLASEGNLEQYERNLKTSQENVKQMKESLAKLKTFMVNLEQSNQGIEKNQATLEPVKNKVLEHIKNERVDIEREKKQIAEVQQILDKLNKQLAARELNVKAYQAKLVEIEKEREGWAEQKKNMSSLLTTVKEKITTAEQEKVKWEGKTDKYQTEVDKWKNQAALSKKQLRHYKRLSD